MTGAALAARLGDGRLHLQHGPIDLIIDAKGDQQQVEVALVAMACRFETILDELVVELVDLRRDVGEGYDAKGVIARRMVNATRKFADIFVTPMAAVAGAVADEVVEVGWGHASLKTLYVNNGGDIALRLTDGEELVIGVVKSLSDPVLIGRLHMSSESAARGIATSGFGGRSKTLGIADAVTVIATCAAEADVAATLIANEVNLDEHPQVHRVPAISLDESSDLGERLVTQTVGILSAEDVDVALTRGMRRAADLSDRASLEGVFLSLRGSIRSVGRFHYRPVAL